MGFVSKRFWPQFWLQSPTFVNKNTRRLLSVRTQVTEQPKKKKKTIFDDVNDSLNFTTVFFVFFSIRPRHELTAKVKFSFLSCMWFKKPRFQVFFNSSPLIRFRLFGFGKLRYYKYFIDLILIWVKLSLTWPHQRETGRTPVFETGFETLDKRWCRLRRVK